VTRLWTGKGDDGTTGLLFGGRASKASPRFEAIGAADEAQAAIGAARAEVASGSELDDVLTAVARDLWVLMAELATGIENQHKLEDGQSRVTPAMVEHLEQLIDETSARFEPPTEFVAPGQAPVPAALDVARTVTRRAERAASLVAGADGSQVVPYLNRLSDLLWTLARWQEGESLITKTIDED
jgi:cob(I)alamin adenosyltransferase